MNELLDFDRPDLVSHLFFDLRFDVDLERYSVGLCILMQIPQKERRVEKEDEVFNTMENLTWKILWKMKWGSAQLNFFLWVSLHARPDASFVESNPVQFPPTHKHGTCVDILLWHIKSVLTFLKRNISQRRQKEHSGLRRKDSGSHMPSDNLLGVSLLCIYDYLGRIVKPCQKRRRSIRRWKRAGLYGCVAGKVRNSFISFKGNPEGSSQFASMGRCCTA